MPPKVLTTQTQESGGPAVVDKLKPLAEIHVLVGGPYAAGGEEHLYGHTAIRVKVAGSDRVYDFGRYGRVVGDFGAEGEGILRVWASFSDYIAGENGLKRKTTGFVYVVFDAQAQSVNTHFSTLIKAAKPRPELARGRSSLTVYQLASNYHALGYNCTTLSLDGVRAAMPTFENGGAAFIKPGDVLSFGEQMAMKTVGGGTPSRLFLPANLEQFLLTKPAVKPTRVDVYGGRK
ncbi:MAG: hypothetical protein V4532_01700 [Pseudomonadota bacterium]